ncbi:type II CAAX prenyl endopeptidase Rce1 family protein [Pontiella sp.]|uniref:CPBP family glutamic-type intramembrane protease n=1 Tax=Pontiella sp. TaxID=2837462 RepID=UPI00356665F8
MKPIAGLIPYVAVLVGMYGFRSAWAALLLYHAGIVACRVGRRTPNLFAGFKNPLTLPGVLVCAMAAPVVYFLWPWLAAREGILPEWLAHYGLTGWSWRLLIPYFSIVHPILEELHWQGMAPERSTGLCSQDLLFAGYHVLVLLQLIHWPWLFMVFGVLVGSSVFWRWAAGRFGGLGLGILTHAAADAGVVVAVHRLL